MVHSFLYASYSIAITLFSVCHAKDGHGRDALFTDFEYDAVETFDVDPSFDGKGWLSENSLAKADEYAKSYANAPLFPHVAIDNFFNDAPAKALLNEFPAFEKGNYLNEYGLPGLKSVNTDIRKVSPNFSKLWKYIGSQEFLSYVSTVTSIPDLLMDPTMFGGGCHENKNGQRLNTHIDFNYNREYRWHRRVNVLFYLNNDWDCAWGGCVTFETNPWCYANSNCNTVKQYEVKFNRAVIFSTSEKSWHGFTTINAPATYKGTRKLISIYLYTRNRPEHELAGSHGTHYIPSFQPPDESALFIREYMKTEVELNRQIQVRQSEQTKFLFHRYVYHPRSYNLVALKSYNFNNDGWIENGAFIDILVPANTPLSQALSLEGFVPNRDRAVAREFTMRLICYAEQGHKVTKLGDNEITTIKDQIKVVTSLKLNGTIIDQSKEYVLTIMIKSTLVHTDKNDERKLVLSSNKKNLRFLY